LLSWLFAIEHSIWLNELRTPQRRRTASLDAEDPWLETSQADGRYGSSPEVRVHYAQVVRAVEALPEAQRVVMLLVAVEGMSYREVADILAVPIGTVMSRLARARVAVGRQFLDRPADENSFEERQHDCR
jgi:RNA polymerase sigma-70 factor (ECF subfamily)